jgi:isocitrate dehydrogenase
LGEFLALAASLEHLGTLTSNPKATILAETLDSATGIFLDQNKSPSRKVKELDNRGSHFYLALYWAQALAEQDGDNDLKEKFKRVSEALSSNENKILGELNAAQGVGSDVGGYFKPDPDKAAAAMRPSSTLNKIISECSVG